CRAGGAGGRRALDLLVAAEGLEEGARIGAKERIERADVVCEQSLPQRSNAGVISAPSGKSIAITPLPRAPVCWRRRFPPVRARGRSAARRLRATAPR